MSTWEEQIEQDLSWREGEIASLKLLAASASKDSDRQRAVLRASWAMLYAHYEGFCKFCWDLLLEAIEKEGHARDILIESLAILSLTETFKKLRGDLSSENLWDFYSEKFNLCFKEPASFSTKLETDSNLWPNVAQANNAKAGLSCLMFETYKTELKNLVGRRNEIAHGRKLIVGDLESFQTFENATFLVMHDLALATVECLNKKTYLKSTIPTPINSP